MIRRAHSPSISFCLWLVAWTLGPSVSSAVEIEPGQTYAGGTSLTASDVGITTAVPTGWQAAVPAGAEALVMERIDQAAYIFVVAEEASESEALSEMSVPIDLGDGIVLHPKAPPSRESAGLLTGDYRVTGTPRPAEGTIYTRIGDRGVGVAYFAIDMGGDGGARQAAKQLATTTRFAAPKPSVAASAGEGTASWQDYMRGRYIARFFTASDYSEKTELWLCGDGSFERSGESGGFGGGFSGAWAGGGKGRWSASGKQPGSGELRLQFADGVSTYALSLEDGSLYLDGTKWLRGNNEYCR